MIEKNSSGLITLADLAILSGCNKSRLAFFASFGILRKEATFGKANVYPRKESIARLKEVEKLKKSGLTLKKIVERMKVTEIVGRG